MRLEGADDAPVGQRLRHRQQGVQLAGMVGVVVVNVRAVIAALFLEAAARAGEGGKAALHGFAADAEDVGGARRGERVHHIVLAADLEGDVGIFLPHTDDVERGQAVGVDKVFRVAVRVRAALAEREERAGVALERPAHAGVVPVGDHMAVGGNELREAAEGVLNVVQVLEEVQMVGLDVENDRDGGEEAQKRVAVFAALGDDGVAVADAVAGVEQRQRTADHYGGVGVRRHEDVCRHAGGGRFAVRAGDAQGVAVAVHDRAPRLRPLKDRDAACDRAGDLGIVIVRRCSTAGESFMSLPCTESPMECRTSARGLIDTPPMPARCARLPGTR